MQSLQPLPSRLYLERMSERESQGRMKPRPQVSSAHEPMHAPLQHEYDDMLPSSLTRWRVLPCRMQGHHHAMQPVGESVGVGWVRGGKGGRTGAEGAAAARAGVVPFLLLGHCG